MDYIELLSTPLDLNEVKVREIVLRSLNKKRGSFFKHWEPNIKNIVLVYVPFWLVKFKCRIKKVFKIISGEDFMDLYVLIDAVAGKFWVFKDVGNLSLVKTKVPEDKVLKPKVKFEEISKEVSYHITYRVIIPLTRRLHYVSQEVIDFKEFYRPTFLVIYSLGKDSKEELVYVRGDKIPY